MGFHACGEGEVHLIRPVPDEVVKELQTVFHVDYQKNKLYLTFDGTYYDVEVEAALDKLLPYMDSGEISYEGDEQTLWKNIYENNSWQMIEGRRIYEDDIFINHSAYADVLLHDIINDIANVIEKQVYLGWPEGTERKAGFYKEMEKRIREELVARRVIENNPERL